MLPLIEQERADVALCAPRTLALAAGGGGLERGVRLVHPRARTVCYVENEVTAGAVLAANMEAHSLDAAPVWTDLKVFDGRPWRGAVDLITGGYPCQPFSNAGKRLGSADPRHLWPYVAAIVAAVEPRRCFFENVGAHLRLGFYEVARDLQGMGYRVAAVLLTAEEVGAPHGRERLFILADRTGSRRDGEPREHDGGSPSQAARPEQCVGRVADTSGISRDVPTTGRADGACGGAAAGAGDHGGAAQLAATGRASRGAEPRLEHHERAEVAARSGRGIYTVGDPDGERRRQEGDGCLVTGRVDRAGRFLHWPPRPGDDWSAIPERLWPATVEPAVRGVADELAGGFSDALPRSDQLHVLGNGVVPAQAAYALRMLEAALGDPS